MDICFWDDNPIEREKIKIQCKDVDVIEPDIDVSNWAKQLLEQDGFQNLILQKLISKEQFNIKIDKNLFLTKQIIKMKLITLNQLK